MLRAMREGSKSGIMKFILFGFMVMAGGGLILMDVGGFFRGGVTRTAIAKIEGQELPVTVFDRTVRRVLASQGLDVQTAYKLGFINQILRSEISNNLMQRAALDLGFQVGDQTVIKQIDRLIEPLVTPEMDKKTALANVLRNQGLGENEFIRMIEAEMTNMLLRNAIQIGTDVPPGALASDLYQYNKEERTAKIVHLPHSTITEVAEPAEEILRSFYQAGQERYAIPETRTFSVAVLGRENLEKTLDVSDEELRQIYDADVATYAVPERRVLEQAVVDNQAAATAIAEALNTGKTLKESVSAETGSDSAYLGEETFEKEGLPKEIGESAFAAETGAVVGPVETALGWHILKVKSVVAPETKTFESVKEDLKKEIIQNRVADQMFTASTAIDDSLAGGASLEDVAAELELDVKTYGPLTAEGSTPDNKDGLKDFGPDWGVVVSTVFELTEGETAPVMELADGRYAAIRVDTVTPKTYKPFEDVKADLAKVWTQDQKEVANKLRNEDALRALNAGEKTLSDIASAHGATVATATMVRDDQPKEPLTDAAKTLFYHLDEGQHGMAPVNDGYVLGVVTNVKLPDPEKAGEEDLKSFTEIAQRGQQGEFMQLYFNHLQSAYDVKINQRLLDQTYGPGSEQQF